MKDVTQLLTTLDNSKECDIVGHQFCCADLQGIRGELVMIKKVLSAEEVSQLTNKSATSQELCPDGQVLCSRCHILFSGEKVVRQPLPVIEKQDFFK